MKDFKDTGAYYKIQAKLCKEWRDVNSIHVIGMVMPYSLHIPLGYPTEEVASDVMDHLIWLNAIQSLPVVEYRVVHVIEDVV